MTCKELLAKAQTEAARAKDRVVQALEGLDEATFNKRSPNGQWGAGQIIEHLRVSNDPYLVIIDEALKSAPRAEGDPAVKHSFVGGAILKAAGPGGNASVPKAFLPGGGPFPMSTLERWKEQQDQIADFARRAEGVDLSRTKVRNPVFKVFPMNLADCFAILVDHTERHVRQIEERIPKIRGS